VADRVRRGGHDVPEDVVRRRFAAGIEHLFAHYLDLAHSWQIYDNSESTAPRLIASRAVGMPMVISDPSAWEHLKEQQR
jgi:predicted ABC-type ATPase